MNESDEEEDDEDDICCCSVAAVDAMKKVEVMKICSDRLINTKYLEQKEQ